MEKALISIVTIAYNCSEELNKTISSVLAQSYPHTEYIIVDGGSTDDTALVLEKYKNHISKIISEKDKGIYDAMNKGWRIATGEYILFMNAGDVFASDDTLEKLIEKNLTQDIVYGNWLVQYEQDLIARRAEDFLNMKSHLPFSHQASLIKKSLLEKYDGFDLQYKICADYDLFLKCYLDQTKFQYIDLDIAIVSSGGYSDLSRVAALQECEQIRVQKGMKPTPQIQLFLSKSKINLVTQLKNILGKKFVSWITKMKYKK